MNRLWQMTSDCPRIKIIPLRHKRQDCYQYVQGALGADHASRDMNEVAKKRGVIGKHPFDFMDTVSGYRDIEKFLKYLIFFDGGYITSS